MSQLFVSKIHSQSKRKPGQAIYNKCASANIPNPKGAVSDARRPRPEASMTRQLCRSSARTLSLPIPTRSRSWGFTRQESKETENDQQLLQTNLLKEKEKEKYLHINPVN